MDPVLVIVSDIGQSKDFSNTVGVIPDPSIPREFANFIDRHGAIIADEV